MSFEVSSLCDAIDKMMQKHLPLEEVRRRDAAGEPPDHLLEVFADMGLFRLVMSEKEGGLGGNWEQLSIIQERLGHSSIEITLDCYTHVFKKYGKEETTRALEAWEATTLNGL